MHTQHTHFFSCDWGTSTFRLKLVSLPDLRILDSLESAHGIGIINKNLGPNYPVFERAMAFSSFLKEGLSVLLERSELMAESIPVMLSGMASSSVGWVELPYAAEPFPIDGSSAIIKRIDLDASPRPTIPVHLVSGVKTDEDMMRGEETQVIGLMAMPEFALLADAGLWVLPGSHSKHVLILDGQITSIQTYMTGEMYEAMRLHTSLRFTTDGAEDEFDPVSFKVGAAYSRTKGVARALFLARSRGVVQGKGNISNRSYLSGLLIGAELVNLQNTPPAVHVRIAAPAHLAAAYQLAAEALGLADKLRLIAPELADRAVVQGHAKLLQRCKAGR